MRANRRVLCHIVAIVLFILGAGHWVWHSHFVSPAFLFSVCFFAAVLWFFARRAWTFLLLAFVIGSSLGGWQLQTRMVQQIPAALDGERLNATWQVVSLPRQTAHGVKFEAEVSLEDAYSKTLGRVLISWYKPEHMPQAGDLWQGILKLKRPRGTVNFGGFDYQAYLLSEGFSATATVKGQPEYLGPSQVWARSRARLIEPMDKLPLASSRFFRALMVADKSAVTVQDWEVLQRTGTVHLMAISGLHIGMIATWVFWLAAFLSRVIALAVPNRAFLIHRFFPPMLSISAAGFYAALAGFSIPTLRALLACVLVNLAVVLGRRFSLLHMLCLCALWVPFFEPFAFLNSGFWLSFSAVLILLVALAHRPQVSGARLWLFKSMHMQWALLVGMSVPLLSLNLPVSLLSPVANLIAVPLVSLVVVPALFVATLIEPLFSSLHSGLLTMADAAFSALWQLLTWMAQRDEAVYRPSFSLTAGSGLWLLAASVCLLAPIGVSLRCVGALLLAALVFSNPSKPSEVTTTVMDVGQGLSVVIETPTRTWVYDTGAKFSDTFDVGERVVAPFLRRKGIREIALLVSHDDQDHAGGAEALVKQFNTAAYWAGEAASSESLADTPCHAGQTWQAEAVQMDVVWPPKHHGLEGNDASCVVLITLHTPSKPYRLLLTGDISRSVEKQLLSALPRGIDLLVSPHHGSKTSSSQAFIDHVQPRYVVHSAGYKHHYGHPHPKVWQRYADAGSQQWNTADSGAVSFSVDLESGEHLVQTARGRLAKPWH